jgi:ubiquinone biosynthesis protein Coq4
MRDHDIILEQLVERLSSKPHGDLLVEQRYFARRGNGEFDVLETYPSHSRYYEVKSHYSRHSVSKAMHQFARAKKCYPDIDWKFILVTPERVRRIRL